MSPRLDPVPDLAAAHLAAAFACCCGTTAPVAAIVLGSGLGGLVSHIEHATRIPFSGLPGLSSTSTPGHTGQFVHGMLCDREVLIIAGRLHLYEGHSFAAATLPVRIVAAMGIRTLVLSNAAGGIRADLTPGTLMLVTDHLSFMGRRQGLSQCVMPVYDSDLQARMRAAAATSRVTLASGVYAAVLGPSYETPAEIRMMRTLGADAVGMSTAPEAVVAAELGVRVVAVSCITNCASGTTDQALSHADVLDATRKAAPRFERLIRAFVTSG